MYLLDSNFNYIAFDDDSNNAKTYIRDSGNYYFSTGNGAHEALNNILANNIKYIKINTNVPC